MDDGSRGRSGARLHTESFEKKDLDRLIVFLKRKYDLNCSLHKGRKNQFMIYIPERDMAKFSSIVKEHLVESMYYKLRDY